MIAKSKLLPFVLVLFSFAVQSSFADSGYREPANSTASERVWTTNDWVLWWTGVEDMYLAGASYEDLYWKVRLDLEALGYAESAISDIPFPDPYPGWSDGGSGGGDEEIYAAGDSRERGRSTPGLQYKCQPIENRCPRGPHPFSVVEPPPGWVAASISLLGGNLMALPHPGGKVVGYVLTNVGGTLTIWILREEEEDSADEDSK